MASMIVGQLRVVLQSLLLVTQRKRVVQQLD